MHETSRRSESPENAYNLQQYARHKAVASLLPQHAVMLAARFLPALAFAAFTTFTCIPSTALACWDGFDAHVGNVEIMGDDTQWDASTLQHHATWLGRINALVPVDTTVVSSFGTILVTTGDTTYDFTWSNGQYRTLFDDVAQKFGTSAIQKQRALRIETPVYVVQAGSFINANRAKARAEAISNSDVGEHGFFEAGGFPSMNPTAHVVIASGAQMFHRVYVGAFVKRSEAEALAKRIGSGAFVLQLRERK